MSRLTLGRRKLLAALGLGTAATAGVFHRGILASAQADAPAQRFIGVYHPAGWRVWPRNHRSFTNDPEALSQFCFPGRRRDADYTLASVENPWPEETAPLQRHQDDLVFLEGLHNYANRGGNNHMAGIHTFLSGADPVQQFTNVGGMTLDYFLAQDQPTQFAGVHFCIQQRGCALSSSGRAQPIPSLVDPVEAYNKYFVALAEGSTADERRAMLARTRVLRGSMLDHVSRELEATRPWVSAVDRHRIDAHASAIRAMETRLDAMPSASAICADPGEPVVDVTDIPALTDVLMDMLVAALACDVSRNGTFAFGRGTLSFAPTFLGINGNGYHGYSHYGLAEEDRQAEYTQLLGWTSERVASLIDRLAEIPESDGQSLLYHSLMVWNTDNSSGAAHTVEDVPFIMAGQAGGKLETGRVLSYAAQTKHNRLLLSIARAFGHDVEHFGPREYCEGGPLGLFREN